MPLYKTITVNKDTFIAIWKVGETEGDLAKGIQLSDHCQSRYDGMKSELHRRAFLSIRHLMALYGYEDKDLYYDEFGKPHLKDGNLISITHSHNFTGIIISKSEEVGIDIEKKREKILRIAHKFTPFEEYRTLANTEAIVRKLTIVWGAKESLYKIYGQQGISFLHHIHVTDFSFSENQTTAEIIYDGKVSHYHVHFMEFEGFTLVYGIRQKTG
ncbi:4'-phosphopantetheinyl transferase family protein [Maribacter cobaltidurans]|uniref:4-phosphopantetheinyl transferase n=1 Tax=Maribacter cobaltidurans TaxID=1178778 RepID=A0A223V5T8_9FLAO|nr:4'-phosphopantetheinyl transferase superfamily protein [Maribacter cobaltidurans]ASV30480.1 4-phosphopantetheinyl transferase [Maribacter cobaltidurans]GGD79068.1 4'-phosphopantetheinyl transferase [Maribacter cobaltidurans]